MECRGAEAFSFGVFISFSASAILKDSVNPMSRTRLIRIVLGCMVFGALMAVRSELHGLWLRAGVAAVAAVLALAIVGSARGRPT